MKAKTSSPPTANNWIPHKVDGSISRGLPLHSPHIPESPRAIAAYPHVAHNCHNNNYKFKWNCKLCQYKERLADYCKDNSYVCFSRLIKTIVILKSPCTYILVNWF